MPTSSLASLAGKVAVVTGAGKGIGRAIALAHGQAGAAVCCAARAVVPALKARGGGKIIFMGSGLGHSGTPGTSSYACAKAGMAMLSSVLAQELWADGISANEILPGPVNTGSGALRPI